MQAARFAGDGSKPRGSFSASMTLGLPLGVWNKVAGCDGYVPGLLLVFLCAFDAAEFCSISPSKDDGGRVPP